MGNLPREALGMGYTHADKSRASSGPCSNTSLVDVNACFASAKAKYGGCGVRPALCCDLVESQPAWSMRNAAVTPSSTRPKVSAMHDVVQNTSACLAHHERPVAFTSSFVLGKIRVSPHGGSVVNNEDAMTRSKWSSDMVYKSIACSYKLESSSSLITSRL